MIEATKQPAWPTAMRRVLIDGRLQGVDGSLWMYRAVPLAPVIDAKSPDESLTAAEPLLAMFEELSDATNLTVKRRALARGAYREIHLLLVNIPQHFNPPRDHPLYDYLMQSYGRRTIDRRLLLCGVKLVDKITSGGWRQAVDSVVETVLAGQTPLSDYDADTAKMSAAMDRAGLVPISSDELRLANAWWNSGANADVPMLVHPDHLHIFKSAEAVQMAEAAGPEDCDNWSEEAVRGAHSITMTSVHDLEFHFADPRNPGMAWVSDMLEAGALAVSIRGHVEPGLITREELRRQRKRFIDDINERTQQGKMERAEQEEMLEMLSTMEGLYATAGGTPPPTLASASIVAGFNGQFRDVSQVLRSGSPASLSVMSYRQNGALEETWLCSSTRANPNLHDLPAQSIACSGLPSLSFVGDDDGALMGFTERDRQPAYLSPKAASAGDAAPILVVPGQTGSGKTLLMLSLADQMARSGRKVIIWDPKGESDHSAVALASGGQVYSLDRLLTADGVFDPIRFSATKEAGVELAASMLMSINPWGTAKDDMEVPLQQALAYGVNAGAQCTGQALQIARRDLQLPAGLVERVDALSESSPQFRAICGVNPQGQSLNAASGITLIKVGSAYLDLPAPGAMPSSLQQRIALALIRMVVFGSAMAVSGEDGVVMFDEAWIVLGAGSAEVERLGRLARSQRVLPMLFTQRVSDALNAGLAGYISRGMILPMEDSEEAEKAFELFKLEATADRMARITAKATMGANTNKAVAPNWNSMRALRDPESGDVLRGTIGIYVDLAGRAVPTEITLSKEFLAMASTNPEDIRRRQEAAAVAEASRHSAMEQAATVAAPDDPSQQVQDLF